MIFKIGFLKNFAIFTGKHLCLLKETPFAIVTGKHLCLLKETPTQVLSFEYYESFKKVSFYRTPPSAAFVCRYL